MLAATGLSSNPLHVANQTFSDSTPLSTTPLSFTNAAVPWHTSGINPVIPGLRMDLQGCNDTFCTVKCPLSDTECVAAASSVAQTCSPQWDAYASAASAWTAKMFTGSATYVVVITEEYLSSAFSFTSTDSSYVVSDHYGSSLHAVYMFGTASLVMSSASLTITEVYAAQQQDIGSVDEIKVYVTSDSTFTTTSPYTGMPKPFPTPAPYCQIVDVTSTACGKCFIGGGNVQLFYWPLRTTVNRAISASITSQMNVSITERPRTAVVAGITMISPTVYISMNTVEVFDACGPLSNNTGTILSMQPQDVSTVFGTHTGTTSLNGAVPWQPDQARRINYADLNGPVPASIYEASPDCVYQGCKYIFNDYYNPILAVPPQLRMMNRAWEDCDLRIEGLRDPPYALSAEADVATLSLPAAATELSSMTTTTAVPSSTPSNPLPSPTVQPGSTSKTRTRTSTDRSTVATSTYILPSHSGSMSSYASDDEKSSPLFVSIQQTTLPTDSSLHDSAARSDHDESLQRTNTNTVPLPRPNQNPPSSSIKEAIGDEAHSSSKQESTNPYSSGLQDSAALPIPLSITESSFAITRSDQIRTPSSLDSQQRSSSLTQDPALSQATSSPSFVAGSNPYYQTAESDLSSSTVSSLSIPSPLVSGSQGATTDEPGLRSNTLSLIPLPPVFLTEFASAGGSGISTIPSFNAQTKISSSAVAAQSSAESLSIDNTGVSTSSAAALATSRVPASRGNTQRGTIQWTVLVLACLIGLTPSGPS